MIRRSCPKLALSALFFVIVMITYNIVTLFHDKNLLTYSDRVRDFLYAVYNLSWLQLGCIALFLIYRVVNEKWIKIFLLSSFYFLLIRIALNLPVILFLISYKEISADTLTTIITICLEIISIIVVTSYVLIFKK
jgi:hypothetical protein